MKIVESRHNFALTIAEFPCRLLDAIKCYTWNWIPLKNWFQHLQMEFDYILTDVTDLGEYSLSEQKIINEITAFLMGENIDLSKLVDKYLEFSSANIRYILELRKQYFNHPDVVAYLDQLSKNHYILELKNICDKVQLEIEQKYLDKIDERNPDLNQK